ncbi:putative serine/threonine-protein kinase BUD32-like protein [Bienertia sinuspersici]
MGRQTCEQQTSGDFGNNRSDKPKSMKSRLPFLVNGWPTDVVYDAKEEKTQVGGILGNRTEQPRSRHCCCGLAGSAGRQGCCRLARAAGADANGKVELISRPIQPIDVLSSNDRRYFVEFNELHQPLRKGGHIW